MSIWGNKPAAWGNKPAAPAPKPVPKPPVKELLPLSQRSGIKTDSLRWGLLAHKNRIFEKYKITGEEVNKFAEGAKKFGGYVEKKESLPLEKKFNISRLSHPGTKEAIKGEKWLKILKDPEFFKK